jgi:hypothetical protein
MPLKRITGMPLQPYTCVCCGQGPTDNEGNQRETIFAEGVDINWGDSVYICADCTQLIADLAGRVTREGFDRLQSAFEELNDRHEALLEKYEEQEELLDKIREGSAAQRAVRSKKKVTA